MSDVRGSGELVHDADALNFGICTDERRLEWWGPTKIRFSEHTRETRRRLDRPGRGFGTPPRRS